MTDKPFMPSKPQWDTTLALLERALEDLAQARDDAHKWATLANGAANERDAAVGRNRLRAAAARRVAQWCRDYMYDYINAYIWERLDEAGIPREKERDEHSITYYSLVQRMRLAGKLIAERDAARAEVARLTAALDRANQYLMAAPTPYEWAELNQAVTVANRRSDAMSSLLKNAGDGISKERAMTLERNVSLALLLEEFIDDDPCKFDHHGYCQTHNSAPPCLMERARAALRGQPAPALCPNCVHPMSAHIKLTEGETDRYICCAIDCKCITQPAPARCGCGHLVSDHRGGACQHPLCKCAEMKPAPAGGESEK